MTILKSLSMATAGAVFIALGTVDSAQAITLVAPNNLANIEGNTSLSFPFAGESNTYRFQQVYGSSQFSSLPGAQYINQLSFRPDTSGAPFTSVLPNIQIFLSTTKSSPDGLSQTFSENIGSNNALVYDGALALTSADTGSANGPKDFDINVNLQTPFLYNPALGNLLLEVKKLPGGSPNTRFDAEITQSDTVSSLFSFDNVNAVSGNPNSVGLVTQFTTTAAGATPPPNTPVPPTTPLPPPTTPEIPPMIPEPPSMPPEPPTEIPFEFSPNLGLLILGAWGAIGMLKAKVQKRKILEVVSVKVNDGE